MTKFGVFMFFMVCILVELSANPDLREELNGIHTALVHGDVQKAFIKAMLLRTDCLPEEDQDLNEMFMLGAHVLFAVERADGTNQLCGLKERRKMLDIAHALLAEVCEQDQINQNQVPNVQFVHLLNVRMKLRECSNSLVEQQWLDDQIEVMHDQMKQNPNDVSALDMPQLLEETNIAV